MKNLSYTSLLLSTTLAFSVGCNTISPDWTWYSDSDGDGYGAGSAIISFEKPEGLFAENNDCNDYDSAINPGAEEIEDGVDNNCNEITDEKFIFVTSQMTTGNLSQYDTGGNLSGLDGGDEFCQNLASAAQLKGTYKAWLSSSITNATDRLSHSVFPYVLVDGEKIASSWENLTNGNLLNAIDLDEYGATPSGNIYVWTNTNIDGNMSSDLSGLTCNDWTYTENQPKSNIFGNFTKNDQYWTTGTKDGSCSQEHHLYCVQQ